MPIDFFILSVSTQSQSFGSAESFDSGATEWRSDEVPQYPHPIRAVSLEPTNLRLTGKPFISDSLMISGRPKVGQSLEKLEIAY